MLRHTRIGLSEAHRTTLTALLNEDLVMMTDLYLQTKLSHWNVIGPHFIAYHELFDDIADHVLEAIDTMAERVTALGGAVNTSVQTVAGTTQLSAWSGEHRQDPAVIARLADLIGQVGNAIRSGIDQAAELEDADTADLFTEVSRQLDKDLWFLEAHID